jgi:hypothetical protein
MPHRGDLKCVANGLLGSFVSRNNDYVGYWALGLLYRRALERHERAYSLAILGAESEPNDSLSKALSAKYRGLLVHLTSHRGIPIEWIGSAILGIEFEHPSSSAYVVARVAKPYLAHLKMNTAFGKRVSVERSGFCWPHNPNVESRSNRYQSRHEHRPPDA